MSKNKILFCAIFVCMLIPWTVLSAQVSSRAKVKSTDRDIFNYGSYDRPHLDKSGTPKIVFSDRSVNQSYEDKYYQRKRSEYKIATPFYIIDEDNGAYRLVEAAPDVIGRPKAFLSFLYSEKHFKDSKKIKYSGWISSDNILRYDHAILNPKNNLPLKYRVGINSPSALFNLNASFNGDSLKIYDDPFLKNRQVKGVSNGEVLYVYKYSTNGEAALVSDKPVLTGTSGQLFGWVPSDMICPVGQNEVIDISKFLENFMFSVSSDELRDTVCFSYRNLQSPFLFLKEGNRVCEDDTVDYSFPISVWDKNSNKLINIKGGDISLLEIRKMEAGMSRMNIHFVFFIQQKDNVKSYINALQNLYLTSKGRLSYRFSATAIDNNSGRSFYIAPTDDFADWIEFISDICAGKTTGLTSGSGFSNAIMRTLKKVEDRPFENNIMIVIGANEQLPISRNAFRLLAEGNVRLLFVQTHRTSDQSYQDFLLEAKSILDNQSDMWGDYISSYIADNSLSKLDLFRNIDTPDANLYLFDFPQNSLSVGGIIFPKGKGVLTGQAFDVALDSIIVQTEIQDSLLLSSLHKHEMRLGLLRSEPSFELKSFFNTSIPDTLDIDKIDRHNVSDTYFADAYLCDSIPEIYSRGFIFESTEVENLLLTYRALLPEFSDSIGNRQLKVLRHLYTDKVKSLNRNFYCKRAHKKSTLADIFTLSTGILPNDSLLFEYTVKELKPKKLDLRLFNAHYNELIKKMKELERLFMQNKLERVVLGRKEYFYIPDRLIL